MNSIRTSTCVALSTDNKYRISNPTFLHSIIAIDSLALPDKQGNEGDHRKSETPVWLGRPAVGAYIIIYGVIALIVTVILSTIQYFLSTSSSAGRSIFPSAVHFGGTTIPYPAEIVTGVIIALIFVGKVTRLAILWATNRHQLMSDGLYASRGIITLENSFLAPMAFSDARLIRTLGLRIAGRGLIIVDANDCRHFYLQYVKNPLEVQGIIRRTLAHPTVRTE